MISDTDMTKLVNHCEYVCRRRDYYCGIEQSFGVVSSPMSAESAYRGNNFLHLGFGNSNFKETAPCINNPSCFKRRCDGVRVRQRTPFRSYSKHSVNICAQNSAVHGNDEGDKVFI